VVGHTCLLYNVRNNVQSQLNNHNKSKKHRSVLRQLGLAKTHDLMEFVADVYDFPMDTSCSKPVSFTPHLFMSACKILKLCLSITLISCTHWFHTGPTVVSLPLDDAMRVITEQCTLGIDIPQCIRAMVKVKKVLNFKRCRMMFEQIPRIIWVIVVDGRGCVVAIIC
jgi:hypothetical protein